MTHAGTGAGGAARAASPRVTVVLCTYNRVDRVAAAVDGVMAQQGCDLELVVVDDGSTDATPDVLAGIGDDRLRVVRRPNGGLGAARNSGLAAAAGEWVVFLDDDDDPRPGWLATLTAPGDDPAVGVSCCAALHVDEQGEALFPRDLHRLGQPFGPFRDVLGSYAAGTFAARTDLVRRAGGYLPGLGSSHQFDLFIRLLAVAGEQGCSLVASPERLLHLETRPAADRPLRNPHALYCSSTWILARYPEIFAGQRQMAADFDGIAGVAAARRGDWATARRRFGRAARARPGHLSSWSRLGLALVPTAGRRVWNRHGAWSSHGQARLGVPDQRPGAAETATGPTAARELFLPWRYRENPAGRGPSGTPSTGGRRLAGRLARRMSGPVVELTDDPGDDRTWKELDRRAPGLVLCDGALERADDPVELLHRLAGLGDADDGDDPGERPPVLFVGTDRARRDPARPLGPPGDPGHRREWSPDQLELLLVSTGFRTVRTWHLGPVPGRRHRMAVLARPEDRP